MLPAEAGFHLIRSARPEQPSAGGKLRRLLPGERPIRTMKQMSVSKDESQIKQKIMRSSCRKQPFLSGYRLQGAADDFQTQSALG